MTSEFTFGALIAGTPLLAVADLFKVSEEPDFGRVRSVPISAVEVNLSGAVSAEERILLQVKKAEGGAHDGLSGAAVLTDTSKAWTVDGLIGKRVYNVTDGSVATITDNDATTVTAALSGGTDNDWDAGDKYLILDAKPSFLQAIEPWKVTDTEFSVALDNCHLFSDAVFELEFANTDAVTIGEGSNVIYG